MYMMMLKIMLEMDRSQIPLWCIHFVCWISKATNTHSKYVILIASPQQ